MAPEARIGSIGELMFEGKDAGATQLRTPTPLAATRRPPAGRRYADRAQRAPGMIHAGDAVVRAFAAAG
jgi:hypothetical protein